MKKMNAEMTKKIDAILDHVREPESQLTVAQLGLVKKVRYNEVRRTLAIYIGMPIPDRCACTTITILLLNTILENLKAAFKKEFPNYGIKLIQV
jgi:metal-sulfur cluster biosynthetic enzyme